MRMDALVHASLRRVPLEHVPHVPIGHLPPVQGAEQWAIAEPESLARIQPPVQGIIYRRVEPAHRGLIALPVMDADAVSLHVHVLGLERQSLSDPQPGPVQQHQQRLVPDARGSLLTAPGQYRGDLGRRQGLDVPVGLRGESGHDRSIQRYRHSAVTDG